jgi:hypothetical protein
LDTDTPLAFSTSYILDVLKRPLPPTKFNGSEFSTTQSRFHVDLGKILAKCHKSRDEGGLRVSKYFSGARALMEALQDAEHDDVVILGLGKENISIKPQSHHGFYVFYSRSDSDLFQTHLQDGI